MKIVKQIIATLFGLMMMNAGFNKFFHYLSMPEHTPEQQVVFDAFGKIGWLMPLVAIVEIIGGLLVIFPRTRTLGALIIFPVLIGILAHLFHYDTSGLPIAVVLLVIEIWILWDNREKLKGIFS